mmetsp:Transcript_80188/g.192364  ORF Transcript_80188/g.192364 Transcript_80188/m.192364 type:complete len:188 (-) Transcript_80188:87-650(-)|eukprot:CAMPEP_0181445678 /NCGR_PEP_ID=MMETSP1110-20121109/25711_1 /TAXON_ID=174948 /ORGANISM="Symbiodinium sp., Strain CCMP421" /LENGTH=187 /DNA_ID=CAMNT_0023569729 /DNA_START=45 /DNA_END=608 /DNA_ORIENTATION=+
MAHEEGFDEDWALVVRVKCLDKINVQTFEVNADESVAHLKVAIAAGLVVPVECQQLLLGTRVLKDHEIMGDIFSEESLRRGGYIGLRSVAPTEASCSVCGSHADLVDFYGKCRGCGQSGGHHFACDQCPQSFPSSYAREVHMKFFHAELSSERKPGLRKLQEAPRWQLPAQKMGYVSKQLIRWILEQ